MRALVFGVPGTHALAIWEGLRASPIATFGMRTELSSGFAADGYARASGRPAPLLLSTGPGALNSLTALMESASAHVPVVAISSQIPRDLIGRGRGFLHDLPDQLASFEPIVKQARRAESADGLAELVADAWRVALTPPTGPVYLEVPVDVLDGPAGPVAGPLDARRRSVTLPRPRRSPRRPSCSRAPSDPSCGPGAASSAPAPGRSCARSPSACARRSQRPTWARAPSRRAIRCAPARAATTPPTVSCSRTRTWSSASAPSSAPRRPRQYELRFSGRLIQIDAAPERIGATYPALAVVGDAAAALAALLPLVPEREADGEAERRVAELRARIGAGLDAQGRELERAILADIAAAAGPDAVIAWDMTIMGYWAAAHLPVEEPRTFLYPLGSGTLGYAWPAALGASAALPGRRVLGVMGDGGVLYALQELASARQHELGAKLLIVDDRGYGILREYQRDAFGANYAVDLVQPDFDAVCRGFGVPVQTVEPPELAGALEWAFEREGPAAVVLRASVAAHQPTP